MTTTYWRCLAIVVAFAMGGLAVIAAQWASDAFEADQPSNAITEQYRDVREQNQTTARQIREQLTPDVLGTLCCDVNCSFVSSDVISLTPTEVEQARDFSTTVLEYSDLRPCQGLEEIALAPSCWLFYFRPQDGLENCLLSIEVYEGGPYAMIVRTFGAAQQPPIVADMGRQEYGAFRELLGTLKCHRRQPVGGKPDVDPSAVTTDAPSDDGPQQ